VDDVAQYDAQGVRVTGIAAGLHAVLELPGGQQEDQVVEHGAVRGLAIEGLGSYALRDHVRGPALVIGYTTPPEHAYTTALAVTAFRTAPTSFLDRNGPCFLRGNGSYSRAAFRLPSVS
jgi:DNA-binding transcriptional MocR family regulator